MLGAATALALTLVGAAVPFDPTPPPSTCIAAGTICPTPTEGTKVVVSGSKTVDAESANVDRTSAGFAIGIGAPVRVDPSRPLQPLPVCLSEGIRVCADYERPQPVDTTPTDPTEPAPGLPPVTITDLAAFTPHQATFAADPAGFGLMNAPTNFVATATTHTIPGTLFDTPVTVRFTPTEYRFDYNDNTPIVTRSTGGTTWEALGQQQFTPTPTSHTYRAKGTYTPTVQTTYTAEVTLDNTTWYPVTGTLTTPPTPAALRIYQAHTALVQHTCQEQPTAPGCP